MNCSFFTVYIVSPIFACNRQDFLTSSYSIAARCDIQPTLFLLFVPNPWTQFGPLRFTAFGSCLNRRKKRIHNLGFEYSTSFTYSTIIGGTLIRLNTSWRACQSTIKFWNHRRIAMAILTVEICYLFLTKLRSNYTLLTFQCTALFNRT